MQTIREVEKLVRTPVVVGAGVRCNEDGSETEAAPMLEKMGFQMIRAKTNFGLGRITNVSTSTQQSAVSNQPNQGGA